MIQLFKSDYMKTRIKDLKIKFKNWKQKIEEHLLILLLENKELKNLKVQKKIK